MIDGFNFCIIDHMHITPSLWNNWWQYYAFVAIFNDWSVDKFALRRKRTRRFTRIPIYESAFESFICGFYTLPNMDTCVRSWNFFSYSSHNPLPESRSYVWTSRIKNTYQLCSWSDISGRSACCYSGHMPSWSSETTNRTSVKMSCNII